MGIFENIRQEVELINGVVPSVVALVNEFVSKLQDQIVKLQTITNSLASEKTQAQSALLDIEATDAEKAAILAEVDNELQLIEQLKAQLAQLKGIQSEAAVNAPEFASAVVWGTPHAVQG